MAVPHKRKENENLTDKQNQDNAAISRRRMPAEHIMTFIKNHNSLRCTFRGNSDFLERIYKVTVNTTALMLRRAGKSEAGYCLRVSGLEPAAGEQPDEPVAQAPKLA